MRLKVIGVMSGFGRPYALSEDGSKVYRDEGMSQCAINDGAYEQGQWMEFPKSKAPKTLWTLEPWCEIEVPGPAPELDEEAQWSWWVKRGRHLSKTDTEIRWALGDLVLEVEPMADSGHRTGSHERLDRYANDIGIEGDTVRTYRSIAAAWPPDARAAGVSWSVHRLLRSRDDRADLLAAIVKEHGEGVTVKQARLALAAARPLLTQLDTMVAGLDDLIEAGVVLGDAEQDELIELLIRLTLKTRAIASSEKDRLENIARMLDPDAVF